MTEPGPRSRKPSRTATTARGMAVTPLGSDEPRVLTEVGARSEPRPGTTPGAPGASRARTEPPVRAGGTRARRPRLSRRLIATSIAAVGACALIALGLLVVYPRVGAWMIRDKVGGKLGGRLGREVHFGAIEVSLGHAVLRDVELRGPHDGETPLVHVDRVDVDFDPWRSLIGSVRVGAARIDGVIVTLRRGADGADNISDVLERLRGKGSGAGGDADGDGGSPGYTPSAVTVTRTKLLADDAVTSSTALVADGQATWTRGGELVAELRGITATSIAAPKAGAAKIGIRKASGRPPVVTVEGGEVALYPRLALSGIGGTIHPDGAHPGEYAIDLAGGYGGVPGNLWTAKGGLDPKAATASIDLEAAKFQLDRLAPILARSPVVDYADTSIDTKIRLELAPTGAKFAGEFHLSGLNVGHPMIADKEVHNLDLSGKIDGRFDRETRHLELMRGDFVARDLLFSVTGSASAPRRGAPLEAEAIAQAAKGKKGPTSGPGGIQELKLRLVIPPIDCQRALDAIPKEMVPGMVGYELRGVFDSDIQLDINWADLDATVFDGQVGINHCRVTKQPADGPKRLKEEFEHYVEYEAGKWMSFDVGESNEDFVPFEDISPHLVNSIMSTEDSAFYSHHGFIPSEFRTALVNDLKAGKFTHGASSITMQMVKNVLLFREKTLARKLQELFLTWHVENTLKKDRILEIYFNVIEYGPALYGIGPAARHFFGKAPKDLTPREATFFSSILPAPKERYKQYCANTVTKLTEDKMNLYLGVMLKRKRLTQEEYDEALKTPLMFVKDGDETEEECLKRTQKAIKNARSTNPMKQSDTPPRTRPKPKKKPPPPPPREKDVRPPV
ncbi:MAG TPA: transglycosylase domain-containing protein [Kofleriaceae bacterium]|nr:transglycosylase domain-containing protein [Kofleriaceae bacterium]